MIDKEGLLKEIAEDMITLYDEHYEDDLCNDYGKFMPCPYFKKGKYGCRNYPESCKLYFKDLIENLYGD